MGCLEDRKGWENDREGEVELKLG